MSYTLNMAFYACAAPLPPPTGISLVNIDQDTLTFNWNSVISNCPINYRTLFECGTCDSSTQATTVTCSGLQLSTDERNCTFNVQTVVCNNIAGNQNSLIVTLKGIIIMYYYEHGIRFRHLHIHAIKSCEQGCEMVDLACKHEDELIVGKSKEY